MSYAPSQINYVRAGSGPPALMIHGNPATHTLWRPLIERVAEERTVYAVDLPGFGGSPAPPQREDYALPRLASLMLEFADLHRLERFDLVGHSFGGAVSLTLAASAPDRLRSLAVITPLTPHAPPLARLLDLPLMERFANGLWRRAPGRCRRWFTRNWTHVSYGLGYSPERAAEVAREADRPDLVPSICGLMLEADYNRYGTAIETVAARDTLPLLLIGAGRDRVIPFEQFEEIRHALHRARCHIFPDSGHVPMWQHADEIAALVREFWKGG